MRNRIRPWEALRAFVKIARNPDDTESGARFVMSLQGNRNEVTFQRFAADPLGGKILAERRQLIVRLRDRDWLASLPEDSLGRAYLRFVEVEELSADGLRSAVAGAEVGLDYYDMDAPRRLVSDRIRDMHDLWHVVTGYSRDLVGESLLIYFSWKQLHTRAFALLIALTYTFNEWREPGFRALAREALRRGRDAAWLPVQDWEALLERPLDEVRETLGVGAPPVYTQVRSDGAPPLAPVSEGAAASSTS